MDIFLEGARFDWVKKHWSRKALVGVYRGRRFIELFNIVNYLLLYVIVPTTSVYCYVMLVE